MSARDSFKQKFDEQLVPRALESLQSPFRVYPEDDAKSEIRVGRFTHDGREYEALEQNRKKPSKFGALARNGHEVLWIKRLVDNQMYLVVDAQLRFWDEITDEGQLFEG